MSGNPLRHSPGIVQCRWKGSFRRQPIIYGHDDTLSARRQEGAEWLEFVEIPHHESTAVEEGQDRHEHLPFR